VTQIEILVLAVLEPADFVLATSPRAFPAFLARPAAERAGLTTRPIYVVGPRTARAARAVGFSDIHEAPAGDAASLADLLAQDGARGRGLYLAGRDRKPALEARCAALGARLIVAEAYHACERSWSAEEAQAVAQAAREGAGVLHYSRRSAALFLENLARAGLSAADFTHLAISEDAAGPIHALGLPAFCAAAPSEMELFALLKS
jgi:uroporphyrinogen-III synthase